jgi:hypothetical protein
MSFRLLPEHVHRAVLSGDRKQLSRLGRIGAMRRIQIQVEIEEANEIKIASWLREFEQIALDAHEDICPVDD